MGVSVREFSRAIISNLFPMYTLRHTYMVLSPALGLTKSGVRWEVPIDQKVDQNVTESSIDQAKRLLITITELERKPYTKMDNSERL